MAVPAVESHAAGGDAFSFVKICLGVYAAALAVSLATAGAGTGFSVAFGGAVALLNLRFLSVFLRAVLRGGVSVAHARTAAVVSFYARFAAVAAALYFMADAGMINFPALMAGLSVVPLTALALAAVNCVKLARGVYERAY